MIHHGSCHCGKVSFEIEGAPAEINECNCSHCSRKGFLLWFVPRTAFKLKTGDADLSTYTFHKHAIQHKFCRSCGVQAFAFGEYPKGNPIAAINVRCLPDLDRSTLAVRQVDGKSF